MKKYIMYKKSYQPSGFLGPEENEIRIGEKDVVKRNWKTLKRDLKRTTVSLKRIDYSPYGFGYDTVKKKDIIGSADTLEELKRKFAEYLI